LRREADEGGRDGGVELRGLAEGGRVGVSPVSVSATLELVGLPQLGHDGAVGRISEPQELHVCIASSPRGFHMLTPFGVPASNELSAA